MELLAKKHSPISYFHPNERFFPSEPDYYLRHVDLVDISTDEVLMVSPTQSQIYDYSKQKGGKFTGTKMVLHEDVAERVKLGNSTMETPIYSVVQNFGPDKIHLTYLFFYPYNGWYDILGLDKVGDHTADIEHMTVELDSKTKEPIKYYYGAHGGKDGTWWKPEDIEMKDGHPVVYLAKHGHGLYRSPGIVYRIYGVAVDKTAKSDFIWNPDIIMIYPEDHPKFNKEEQGWYYYTGNWSDDGIVGVPLKDWYSKLPEVSFNPYIISTFTWENFTFLLKIGALILLVILSGLLSSYTGVDRNKPIICNYRRLVTIVVLVAVFSTAYIFMGKKAIKKFV